MAKDTTNGKGHNLTALKKQIAAAVKDVKGHKTDRKASNDEIAAIKANLEAAGIPKKVFDAVLVFMDLSPEEREGWDFAMEIAREAVGFPITDQQELFTREERDAMRAERLKKEGGGDDADGGSEE